MTWLKRDKILIDGLEDHTVYYGKRFSACLSMNQKKNQKDVTEETGIR